MRKILAFILCVAALLCLFSCNKKEKKTSLTTDNVFELVSHTLTFGEITVRENTNTAMSGKYYVTCTATLRISPCADLSFINAKIWLGLNFDKGWYAVRVGNNNSGTSLIYDWDDVIRLDKDGYAERTIELFCYTNSYDKLHPSNARCDYTVCSVEGTVTEK